MRILKNISIIFLLLALIVAGFATAAYFGHANRILQNTVSIYLRLSGYPVKIHHLEFYKGKLSVDNATVRFSRNYAKFHKISAALEFKASNFSVRSDLNVETIELRNEKNQVVATSALKATNYFKLFGLSDLDLALLNLVINSKSMKSLSGKADVNIMKKKKSRSLQFYLSLDENTYFKGEYDLQTGSAIKASASGENIPLELCALVKTLFPSNKLAKYLGETIKSGRITDFKLNADIEEEFFKTRQLPKNSLSVEFNASDVTYSFNPDLPSATNIEIKGHTVDSLTILDLTEANLVGFDFSGTTVEINRQKSTMGLVEVNGSGSGPTAGITEFIPLEARKSLARSGIDLGMYKGKANANLDLRIPLDESIPPTLNINAHMKGGSLAIFDGRIILTKSDLEGKFLNGKINISGNGLINGYKSDLGFELDITKRSSIVHKLTVDSLIKKHESNYPNRDQKLAFLSILDGSAKVHFEQFSKGGKNYFNLYSDLTGIDLYFDKLGIHKKRGEEASLQSAGHLIDCDNCTIDFNVSGANDLSMIGKISKESDHINIAIPKLHHGDTKAKAHISMTGSKISTELFGELLDLSDAKMLQFLEKERESNQGETYLTATIDKVKLKNNIWLDNLALEIKCDETRCFAGNISAFIGKRAINMDLSADGDEEEWQISSTNAGATLKGLGAYDSMKAGNLKVNIRTSRKEIRPGEIIPVHHGEFNFDKFVLTDAPAITRIVSFVSLPGFVNMITNNKDLVFANMKGEFSFDKDILQIKNAKAIGPFFDFTINGNVNIKTRHLDISGHVTPELYGVSSIVKYIPLFGTVITGGNKGAGIISAPYNLNQDY